MINLISMEFKKYRKSGIYLTYIIGSIGLLAVFFLMFTFNKANMSLMGSYNYEGVNFIAYKSLTEFFTPIVAAFLTAYLISFEYKNKTIKNMIASSYSRWEILSSKFIYTGILVFLFNMTIFLGCVPVSLLLGLGVDWEIFKQFFNYNCYWTLLSLSVIPVTGLLALAFKNFAVPFTVSTILIILKTPMGYLYDGAFSPWTLAGKTQAALENGIALDKSFIILMTYCAVFLAISYVLFEKSDQHA